MGTSSSKPLDLQEAYNTLYINCPITSRQQACLQMSFSSFVKNHMNNPKKQSEEILKICNHPFLLKSCPKQKAGSDIYLSGKMIILDKLLKRLKSTNIKKIIILTESNEILEIINTYLSTTNINFIQFDNSIRGYKRQNAIDNFNSSTNFIVLLCSFKSGLDGINLSVTDSVIIYDSKSSFSDIIDNFAKNQIGKTKTVVIYRLVAHKSYEQMILDYIDRKNSYKNISTEKIEKLLRYAAFYAFKNFDNTIHGDVNLNEIIASSKQSHDVEELYEDVDVESHHFWRDIVKEKVDDIDEAIGQHEIRKKELEGAIFERQRHIELIHKENELIKQINELHKTIDSMNQKIQEFEANIQVRRLNEGKQIYYNREEEIQRYEQTRTELEIELNQKQNQLELIQKEIKLMNQINELYGKINSLNQKIQSFEVDIQSKRISEGKNPYYDRELEIQYHEQTKRELENNLNEKKKQLEMIQKEINLKDEINEIYRKIDSYNSQIQIHESNVQTRSVSDIVDRENAIKQYEKTKRKLENELDEKIKQVETMKRVEEERRRKEEEMIRKENELRQKMNEMNSRINSLNQKIQIPDDFSQFDNYYLIYGSDFNTEIDLINERRDHDIYPQSPDYCISLLREEQSKRSVVVSFSKSTSPYWTWFFYKPGFTKRNINERYDYSNNIVYINGKSYECDQSNIVEGYDSLIQEMKYIKERESHDHYPQGTFYSIDTLARAVENKQSVLMFIKQTCPYWTWFYFLT